MYTYVYIYYEHVRHCKLLINALLELIAEVV